MICFVISIFHTFFSRCPSSFDPRLLSAARGFKVSAVGGTLAGLLLFVLLCLCVSRFFVFFCVCVCGVFFLMFSSCFRVLLANSVTWTLALASWVISLEYTSTVRCSMFGSLYPLSVIFFMCCFGSRVSCGEVLGVFVTLLGMCVCFVIVFAFVIVHCVVQALA